MNADCADDCAHPSHQARPVILGLVGPSGGGKTTVCDRLASRHGFIRVHVAEPLKRAFESMWGVGPEYCLAPLIDRPATFLGGITPRTFLEHLGTRAHELAPSAMPLATRDAVMRIIKGDQASRIIVDGIRRVAEAEMVCSLGGYILRIDGRPIDAAKPCDISQTEVREDFAVHFSPQLYDLHREVDAILDQIMAPPSRAGRPGRRADDALISPAHRAAAD